MSRHKKCPIILFDEALLLFIKIIFAVVEVVVADHVVAASAAAFFVAFPFVSFAVPFAEPGIVQE